MMKRATAIITLLFRTRDSLREIRGSYAAAVYGKEAIPNQTKCVVKNILDDLKSCLDYIAQDIHEKYHPHPGTGTRKIGFPFAQNPKEFRSVIASRVCPNLDKSCPPLYAYLESLNYSNPSNVWLKRLNSARNDANHSNFLTIQKEVAATTVQILNPQGGVALELTDERGIPQKIGPFTFVTTDEAGNQAEVVLQEFTYPISIAQTHPQIRQFDSLTYKFEGAEVSVTEMLGTSAENIKRILLDVMKYLD